MNTKKLQEKFEQLPEGIQTVITIMAILFTSIAIAIVIVGTLAFFDSSHCLDSQYPRRWNGKCEEYHDGRWGEPLKDSIYYYNGAGSRITE